MATESMDTVNAAIINAAIIAGNSPEKRVETLREFWSMVSSSAFDFGLDWSRVRALLLDSRPVHTTADQSLPYASG
jgi:hypothetical protein